jgi:hypothetical protein
MPLSQFNRTAGYIRHDSLRQSPRSLGILVFPPAGEEWTSFHSKILTRAQFEHLSVSVRGLFIDHYVEVLTPGDGEAWFCIRRSG